METNTKELSINAEKVINNVSMMRSELSKLLTNCESIKYVLNQISEMWISDFRDKEQGIRAILDFVNSMTKYIDASNKIATNLNQYCEATILISNKSA